MHKILVHAQHSCACTTLLCFLLQTLFFLKKNAGGRTMPSNRGLCSGPRFLCMRKILVHAQHSCACTTLLCFCFSVLCRLKSHCDRPKYTRRLCISLLVLLIRLAVVRVSVGMEIQCCAASGRLISQCSDACHPVDMGSHLPTLST